MSLLEDLKTKLKTGDDEWGIPVLDPFTSAQESINIKEEIITCLPFIFTFIFFLKLNNIFIHIKDGITKFCIKGNWKQITTCILLYFWYVRLDALLTNINVQGISEYDVIDGDFSLAGLKLAMNLSWPRIEARTNYAMNGIVADSFEISGNGSIKWVFILFSAQNPLFIRLHLIEWYNNPIVLCIWIFIN